MSLISTCHFIALALTSNTMLNNTGWRRHSCLDPDLRVESFTLSPFILSILLPVGFGRCSLSTWRSCCVYFCFSGISCFSQFSKSWMGVEFCHILFLNQMISLFDSFSFSYKYGGLFWWIFFNIEPDLHP